MKILRTVREVRTTLEPFRGRTVGLVPTMGALHQGHVRLLEAARQTCDVVVMSLFVNPTQFGDPADLSAYPRDERRDAEMAGKSGVDYLFAPDVEEMYPEGHATWVEVGGAGRGLEGEFRPGHFRGVATVCLKLFAIVAPSVAFFGQKDAQQVAVIRQVVRDLNLGLRIERVPTVRDADGLALSSRNSRLSTDERRRAAAIPRALRRALTAHRNGEDPLAAARSALGDVETEYVSIATFDGHPTLAVAVRVGRTRLIDNVVLDDRSEQVGGISDAPPTPEISHV